MFKNILNKPFWVNLLIGIALVIVLLFGFLYSLKIITEHGETLTIPSVTGLTLPEATNVLEDSGFEVMIQDSVYVDTVPPLMVMRQFPESESVVKKNRIVYLTVNRAVPPLIEMPNFINMTFRSAELAMKQYGLVLKDTFYRTDFARNAVLEQQVDGKPVKPGTKVHMGTAVTLILGSGLGDTEFRVPDFVGLTYMEALALLESSNLNLGARVVDNDVRDTLNAYVYRQYPARYGFDGKINRIKPGQTVDLWIGVNRPERILPPEEDQMENNPNYQY